MPLPDFLPIPPFTRSVHGEVTLPGSKSLTNRALLLAALCEQPVTLTGALFSDDTALMAEALRHLGFTVEADENALTLRVANQANGFTPAKADLFVGLAGTAARFLTALCAAAPQGVYRIDGVPQMRKRPMKGLIDALRSVGADIRCEHAEGFFPLLIHARGLKQMQQVTIDAQESSQLLSALMMISPLSPAGVSITLSGEVRQPFIRMTEQIMRDFGAVVSHHSVPSEAIYVANGKYAPPHVRYAIEPDATAASYFLALPLVVGGQLVVPHLRGAGEGFQGDTRFTEVLQRVGGTIEKSGDGILAKFDSNLKRHGVDQDFSEFSDTFLTLAAIAPLLEGPTRITGIAHTRKQETDRVAGMARELSRLGQHIIETDDSLEIHPRPILPGQTIETYHDHRFAMSFGLLGCYDLLRNGRPWLTIRDPGCSAKTFPHFFELLESLRQKTLNS